MKPSILDRSFKYVSAANTDIRKGFDRERKRLREKADAEAKEISERLQQTARVVAVFDERRRKS